MASITDHTPPVPTQAYLSRSSEPVEPRQQPQKLLLVLDLNGKLLARGPRQGRNTPIQNKPGVEALLQYLFKEHVVMVYSSAMERNVGLMVDQHTLFTQQQREQLVVRLDRSAMNLSDEDFKSNTQTYKNFNTVWTHQKVIAATPEGAGSWNMENTVVLDDSVTKMVEYPYNLIHVSEFEWKEVYSEEEVWREKALMQAVQAKLEKLKYCKSVTSQIKAWKDETE